MCQIGTIFREGEVSLLQEGQTIVNFFSSLEATGAGNAYSNEMRKIMDSQSHDPNARLCLMAFRTLKGLGGGQREGVKVPLKAVEAEYEAGHTQIIKLF